MGGDKHGSKSGRYVGGFLQLFDWNAKSKKKLFSSKSDLPEQYKQGKRVEGNLPMTRMRVVDDADFDVGLNMRGGSEYSYASSVTDDDGYGSKAPGVVAKLMGLDSLPTSNAMEPYPSSFYDTLSHQDAPFRGRNLDLYQDHQFLQSRHLYEKVEPAPRITSVSRPQRMPHRPIEKFQTEFLPPKSAKTIPITHHKLLSPIKSPIFVPSQDAAHIMEAASRIIEPGPQANPRTKISSVGSSSVPFRVRELRERVEAAQRPSKVVEPSQRLVESNAAKYLRGQPMTKSWNGTVETAANKVIPCRDDSSAAKNKSKSISLAIQAKVNVQKRESLTSNSKSFGGSEEQDDTMSTHSSRNQASSSKISNRKTLTLNTSVLRQNNQKQNCPPYRDKSVSKPSLPSAATSAGRKVVSENPSYGIHKSLTRDAGISRTSSRKSSLQTRDSGKAAPYSGARNTSRKKRSIDDSLHYSKNRDTDDMRGNKHEKPSQSRVVADKQLTLIEESRRKGMDVVSFTFSAPITRSVPSRCLAEKCSNLFTDDSSKTLMSSDITRFSSPGLNGIRGDDLSILLEQKLKELASNLGSPHSFAKTGASAESAQETENSPGTVESAIGRAREKAAQRELRLTDMDRQLSSGLFTCEPETIRRKFNSQVDKVVEEYDDTKTETKQWKNCPLPSPSSILEPSMLTESCYSSESIASSCTDESKLCSSVLAQEVVGLQKLQATRKDMDTSDSASSTSFEIIGSKDTLKSTAWELRYVKDILWNVELMFKDYVTGRTREIVNPHLFDQMERRKGGSKMGGDEIKLGRKVLFDCVSECLDLKCQQFVGCGFDMWAKGTATLKRKERLAEEVYKEIQGWRSLGSSMVDELVDKDMSSKYGRWLDFEVDEFALGVEIEGEIIDDLVVDIVADMLPCKFSLL